MFSFESTGFCIATVILSGTAPEQFTLKTLNMKCSCAKHRAGCSRHNKTLAASEMHMLCGTCEYLRHHRLCISEFRIVFVQLGPFCVTAQSVSQTPAILRSVAQISKTEPQVVQNDRVFLLSLNLGVGFCFGYLTLS